MEEKDKKLNIDYGVIAKYGFVLFAIAVVCTLLLALTNMITEPVIAERNVEANIVAQQAVLPEADEFESLDNVDEIRETVNNEGGEGDIIDSVDVAYSGDEVIGYSIKTLPSGYGGEIEMLTGIDREGTISGIYILNQSETAGLGARSTEAEFQDQFDGLSAEEPVVVEKGGAPEGNEIQAISGATITSNAVTTGVNTSQEAAKVAEELNE